MSEPGSKALGSRGRSVTCDVVGPHCRASSHRNRWRASTVKQKLGLSINPITDVESVLENATTLRDLIMTLSSFTIEELQKRGWFDEYEDQTDNALSETLEIHKNDLIDISQTIETIRENTFIEDEDEFDEDNEDDEDVDMEMEDYE